MINDISRSKGSNNSFHKSESRAYNRFLYNRSLIK